MHDTEQTTFDAAGTVLTADGSRFDISLEATLSRAFHSPSDVSVRAGDGIRKDPLVIHFLLARCGALTPAGMMPLAVGERRRAVSSIPPEEPR